jgi:hypothetical protein
MKIFLMVIMLLSIFTATLFFTTPTNSEKVFAVCSEINNTTTYCHEQYNTHSNTATTTITEEKEEPSPLFCIDLECNLSDNDLLDSEIDTINSPLNDLEY